MKIGYIIILVIVLNGCYTQFEKRLERIESNLEISDSTVFLPKSTFSTIEYSIKDIYGTWINSREEENDIIKIYRPDNYKKFPPTRFRDKIIFYENGECEYLMLEPNDGQRYLNFRWRLLKENPNFIYLYNQMGAKHKSLRIEKLSNNLLAIVWVY